MMYTPHGTGKAGERALPPASGSSSTHGGSASAPPFIASELPVIGGGQGRDENDMDGSAFAVALCGTVLIFMLALAAVTLLGGCTANTKGMGLAPSQVNDARRGADEDGGEPAGDELPAPKRVTSQYLGGDKTRERASEAESKKALEAADKWVRKHTIVLHEKE